MNEPVPFQGPSEDPDHALAHEAGWSFVQRLAALLRTARTHDTANVAFQERLREFLAAAAPCLESEDEATLAAVGDQLYLNGVRLKGTTALLPVQQRLIADLTLRDCGGVRFVAGVTEAEIERFVPLFLAAEDPALASRLPDLLVEAGIDHVAMLPPSPVEPEDLARELDGAPDSVSTERARARQVFWRAMVGSRRILLRARSTGRPDLRHAKRLVQPIVDSLLKNEYSLVGLTALKDHDEYTYAHCVNVSVLAVGMGQSLGLSRQSLADLGVSGLLHDIGKMTVSGAVLRKPGALDGEEWRQVRRHPIEGAKMVARMPGLSQVMVDAMRASLEHHMNLDRTGYPEVAGTWGQATLSRLVAMADCFDAMTAHRVYAHRPHTAFEALQVLLGPNRVHFDPAVLWALLRTVGLYPAGTVMQTDNGHIVLSLSPNPADIARPVCRVLVRPDGRQPDDDVPELWEPMPVDVSVTRVLPPEEHGADTHGLLAA